ncbi:hypothetical protein KHP57_18250, partial [Algiphilus sp. NNCM1]|nr:hypothetical protein [Algiphilus acroporae]
VGRGAPDFRAAPSIATSTAISAERQDGSIRESRQNGRQQTGIQARQTKSARTVLHPSASHIDAILRAYVFAKSSDFFHELSATPIAIIHEIRKFHLYREI